MICSKPEVSHCILRIKKEETRVGWLKSENSLGIFAKRKMSQKQLAELFTRHTRKPFLRWELNKSALGSDYDQLIVLSKIYRKSIDALLGQAKPSF